MPVIRFAMVALTLAALAQPGTAGSFSYNDFSSTAGLTLNGNAAAVGGVLRLTPAAQAQSGSAFSTTKTSLGVGDSFSTYFQFQMTGTGGTFDDAKDHVVGADGFVFVIQPNSNSVGGNGAGIGYGGISPSLGIEFDTFYNDPRVFAGVNDPDGNHVGVDVNGSLISDKITSVPTLFNLGQVWNVWIDYNGTTGTLEGRWSLSNVRPTVAQITDHGSLQQLLGTNSAYVGFTAGTGASYENHDILNWQFRDSFDPIGVHAVPEPSSIALLSVGGICVTMRARKRMARLSPR